jgi:hypothetical protein
MIVVLPPVFDAPLGIVDRGKLVHVQEFVAQPAARHRSAPARM